ncbi:MAG TPA: hypothetical protein VL156_18930 [Terriglobales bacterium]|nr:hypothetical protein [Terriglobales bacterium]
MKYGSEFELNAVPAAPHMVVEVIVLLGVAPIENFVSSVNCGSDCFNVWVGSLFALQYIVTAPLLVWKYMRDVVFFCSAKRRHLCAKPETLPMLPRSLYASMVFSVMGVTIAAKINIIAITIRSSIKLNPRTVRFVLFFLSTTSPEPCPAGFWSLIRL